MSCISGRRNLNNGMVWALDAIDGSFAGLSKRRIVGLPHRCSARVAR